MLYLLICIFFLGPISIKAEETLFDNFDSMPKERWEFISDQVMGGVSHGNVKFFSSSSQSFARMTGNVSTKNNGGFIQFRRMLTSYFKKNKQGFKLKVRGNGNEYFLHIRTTATFLPWQYYQAAFSTTDKWEIVKIPLINFKPSGILLPARINAEKIRSVGIVAFGKNHEARVDVQNISVY